MIDLRIFVSSPHDVGNERGVCGTVVSRLQLEFRGLVRLRAIFWENELLRPDQTFQSQIPRASEADACLFILWSWFGTPLPATVAVRPDGTTYLSGTEFEFEDAMASRRTRGTPDIFVYRKVADVPVSVRSRDVELMQRSQRDALDGFLDKWFRGEGGTFKAAFYEFEHPAGFERLLEIHLRRWILDELEKAGVAEAVAHRDAQWAGSPFRGLRPFDIEDALIFCGRTQAVTELLDLLRGRAAAGRPFALVVGRSGAGKSSLVRAGLLPMLTQPEVIQGAIAWRRAVFRPSDVAGRPLDALAAAILSDAALPEIAGGGTDAAALATLLGENPAAAVPLIRLALARLGDTARAALPPGTEGDARLAIVIDQFEEIFTREGVQTADRAQFVTALHALAGSGQVWIVATMRADFYPRCEDLPSVFLELCPRNAVFELMPPTPEEISQMIRRPARLAGLDFEKRADQEQGLDDVLRDAAIANPGSLPLLQFALEELYTRAGKGRLLSFADYEAMGRLQGALQVRAEAELKALPEDAQAALPLVLSHLVQLDLKTGAIAQRRLSYERVAADPLCRRLIDWFVDKRLFERDRGGDGETVVGVAHEALLRSWKRAQEWIDHNMAFLRLRARIGAAEVLWREEGRPDRLLLPEGRALKDAAMLKGERGAELTASELAYIDQSLGLARRQRSRRLHWLAAAGVAAVAIVAGAIWYDWAYVMPTSAYYEFFELRWGFPEGRRLLSAQAASHSNLTYKLTRRGALGKVFKVERINGYGKCPQANDLDTPFGESFDWYDYTSRVMCSVEFEESGGRVAREVARDGHDREIYSLYYTDWSPTRSRAQYSVDKGMRPETSGAVVIQCEYVGEGPSAGLVERKWFTDATGEPKPNKDGVFGFRHGYENGNTVEVVRLGRDGNPIEFEKRFTSWRNLRDARTGRVISSSGYSRSGAKMLGSGGYWRVEYAYDEYGNDTAETYYDLADRPLGRKDNPDASAGAKSADSADASARSADNKDASQREQAEAPPVARWTASYDAHGNQVEIRRFDWRGRLVSQAAGVAIERIAYDGEGRRISHAYFDADDRPMADGDGDTAFRIEYDSEGNRSAEHYLDGDLKPYASARRQYATIKFEHDAFGNEIDQAYFDVNDAPTHDKYGIGRIHYEYFRDLESEAIWFDEAGNRKANSSQFSRRHTDYDGYGRVSEEHYYDEHDKPSAVAAKRVLYDQNGNQISLVYLDDRGHPTNQTDPPDQAQPTAPRATWAEWIQEFDRQNRLVRKLYFDAAGRTAVGTDKYAVASWRYDDAGNKVRSEYLGADWKPIAGPDGYAQLTWRYEGNVLAERQYFLPDGTSTRVHLDAQGHEVETEYLDAGGRLTPSDALGCARVTNKYDDAGFLLETAYFDPQGHLCVATGLRYARTIRVKKGPRTSLATYQDASGAPTTSKTGAMTFQWTAFDAPNSGEARHIMPDGAMIVVVFADDLIVEQQDYDAAGEPTDRNEFKAYRVTFAYGSDKKLSTRVLYRADGVETRERWVDGVPVELVYTDRDGHPTDKNDLQSFRVVFVNDAAGNMKERIRYRAEGLVEHDRFSDGLLVEMLFTDASGNPTDENAFGAPRVTVAYDGDKNLLERTRHYSDGTLAHERFRNLFVVETDYTDAEGKPTDQNGRHALRVLYERAPDGTETGSTAFWSKGRTERWTSLGGDGSETTWRNAKGELIEGPWGFAHCRRARQQETCTDSKDRIVVNALEVQGVLPDSTAARVKLEAGDLIVSYDGWAVGSNGDEFRARVVEPGPSPRQLVIARGGHRIAMSVPPGRLGVEFQPHYVPLAALGTP